MAFPPRPIPKGKAPSVTIVDIKPKKPGMNGDAAPPDDAGGSDEGEFRCPSCGANLCVEEKSQEDAEEPGGEGGEPDDMGAGGKY